MRKVAFIMATGAFMWGLGLGSAQAVTADLAEYAFNIDGNVSTAPSGVNTSTFNTNTGLGVVNVTISGVGTHYVASFFDHELSETTNTFFNEYGSVSGAAAAGQSWEIDEPGFVSGDIYDHFVDKILDNSIGVLAKDDVSMAMGWDFILGDDETAKITFSISDSAPTGFFLTQTDPDSGESLYFSSTITINNGQPVPEPSTLFLIGTGLAVLASRCRRKAN